MSIFHEIKAFAAHLNWGTPRNFRVKLTLLLMLVVCGVTLVALYFAQSSEQASYQQSLRDKFQSRLGFLLGAQETREAEVSAQCRLLAQSVRLQAALEEEDVEDLYAVARIELRNVLNDGSPQPPDGPETLPRANFFRFLKSNGELLRPPSPQPNPEPWEEKLAAAANGGPGKQESGYVAVRTADGGTEIDEVVTTPILGESGETTAFLVLGFPPSNLAFESNDGLKTGICLDGQLHMPALSAGESEALSGSLAKVIEGAPYADNNFMVQIHGEPYLLFYKMLNPGSQFAPAYEICLYSLADSIAHQKRLRWRIVGFAGLVLVAGMGASHFLSKRISRPVEQLEEASAQNVARREEAEAARELTEQKYRSIFENAVEGIFLLSPEGRYLSANPAMARIFGHDSPGLFIAKSADREDKLYVEGGRAEEFLRRAKTDGGVSNFECEMRRQDGSTIWVSQNARAARNAAGGLLHFEGTMEDITERKQSADSLRKLNLELGKALADLKATQNQIIQQERLRALGQMASGIAHDFNNSLMPVMGFAELLLANPAILDDKKKAAGYIETIRTAAKDAASIVARLREFYRTNENSDVFTSVNLSQLVRQAVSLTQPKWKDQAQSGGVEIRIIEELAEVPAISGDESALREVIINLIFNAVDAMPSGGSITLRTRSAHERVAVEVSDTGSGMSEEVRQRCLEPFFTTKGERGTGLGLAMVFGIVQRHAGTIDIKTSLGSGTTFIVGFPLRAATAATTATQTAPLPAQQQALRILLVDDDPQVREVLAAFLDIDGHSVETADQGAEGLRRCGEAKFDLVITDKAMPGMSGDQMALEIRKSSPRMPVILLSGFNSTEEDEKVPGVSVIASKPITMPALRVAIRKAMETA